MSDIFYAKPLGLGGRAVRNHIVRSRLDGTPSRSGLCGNEIVLSTMTGIRPDDLCRTCDRLAS